MSNGDYIWLRPKHADIVGVSIQTIRNWIKQAMEVDGELLGYKAGGRFKINPRLLSRVANGPELKSK